MKSENHDYAEGRFSFVLRAKILALTAAVLLLGATGVIVYFNPDFGVVKIKADSGNAVVLAEIADSQQKWETGLMYRESLATDRGMLFIFPSTLSRTFTMENTFIPLDIIFIAGDGTILYIYENARPGSGPVYTSPPSRYVLEVNGGFCTAKGIKVGDKINIGLYRHPYRYARAITYGQ